MDKVTSSSFSPRSCRIQGARPYCWCPTRPPPVHLVLAILPSSKSLTSTEDGQRLQQPLHQISCCASMKTVQQQESLERRNSPPGETERKRFVSETSGGFQPHLLGLNLYPNSQCRAEILQQSWATRNGPACVSGAWNLLCLLTTTPAISPFPDALATLSEHKPAMGFCSS